MKNMGFTKSRWTTLFERYSLLALFVCCFTGLQNLSAQVVISFDDEKGENTCETVKLESCGGTVTADDLRWTDDGKNDGNYADPMGRARTDTIEFCPKDKWHRVKVVFTDFDLAAGDVLNVYQGDKKAVRGAPSFGYLLDENDLDGDGNTMEFIWDAAVVDVATGETDGGTSNTGPPGTSPTEGLGFRRVGATNSAIPIAGTGTGVGVARAFGGWIDASCSPAGNATGCLTFILRTNGDNRKGSGWDAWVDCQERDVKLTASISDKKVGCELAFAEVILPAAKVVACDETLIHHHAEHEINVYNQHGDLILETHTKTTPRGPFWFGAGQYVAEYVLKSDKTKKLLVPFSVQVPNLVANDNVTIPLGAACMAEIKPDYVLENPCPVDPTILYYTTTITIPGAHGFKDVVKTSSGTPGNMTYPFVTAADIANAGQKVCDVQATVRVDRIMYENGPPFPGEYYNGTLRQHVEGKVSFIDEQAPWVDIATIPDSLIACDTMGLAAMLDASGVDNCDPDVPVTLSVTYDEKDPCFAENGTPNVTRVTVTFTATDDCGNTGSTSKEIVLVRPDLDDPQFVAKTRDVVVECGEDAVIPVPGVKVGPWNNNSLDPKTTDTVYLSTEEYICGYILVAEDEDIPSTDCGKKKYRHYSVLDWCDQTSGIVAIDRTYIETTDLTAPEFDEGTGAPVDIELDHFSCTYDIHNITKPTATDNCTDEPLVRIDMVARIENNVKWPIDPSGWAALDCDSFSIKWIAEDECHEQIVNDTIYQTVVIKDVTKPSAACIDELNVSVPNEWGARVYATDIDAGSYDACGIKSTLIRIKGSGDDFAEYVTIGCEYVHPNVQIELKVTDKKGNYNICWLDVEVEDKINPYCYPLDDVTADCERYHNGELGAGTDADEDFEMEDTEWAPLTGDLLDFYNAEFGYANCEDNLTAANCGELTYEHEYQLIEWPCGEAKAKRRYRSKDWSGNYSSWAEQKIVITATQNWKITLPSDWEGACGDDAPAEDLVINNGPCDLLGYEVTEKQFDIPGDACFKIERTYHIINWCKYVAGDEPVAIARAEGDHGFAEGFMVTSEGNEDAGYWTYIQVLKIHDDEAPEVTVINPDPCINGVDYDAVPYGEEDATPGFAPFECDEEKTWSAIATDCSSKITWEGRLYNASTGALVKTVQSHELTYVVSNKESYYAEFWAYDNCGNSAGNRGADVKFWDCKKPTPYVLNGVAVELMPTGMVQVWATDLDQNSFDNCTDQSKLDFRIWADHLGPAPTDLAGVQGLGKVITFDCDRVGTNVVYIFVIDEEENWDFAQTYVIVQDNMGACSGDPIGGMVAGTIVNPQGENVESVNITVSGGMDQSQTTGADGHFMFMLETGMDYTLTPVKDINPLNGVSTFDLVLISKHILGITAFDSPYKHIAADVNKSGTITAFDMVQLRQLILNITSEFPNNDSWRFVDASHEFTSANAAAEDFDEFYTITTLNTNMENLDFVGVKVGDVNGNAQANSLLGAESRSTNGALTLAAADRYVEVGETVSVAFTAADIATTQGYQFTLNFAGKAGAIEEGIAKAANFNTKLADRGVIATSWNGEATADDVLFTLRFQATAPGLLSDLVSVSSDITQAEAYNTAGELMDVAIEFNAGIVNADFELGQNTPNPFNDATVIGFNLPEAGSATLTVMDAQGKVLKSIKADYGKGYNQVSLKANELGATGILYYQLESADNVATKKMIVIE